MTKKTDRAPWSTRFLNFGTGGRYALGIEAMRGGVYRMASVRFDKSRAVSMTESPRVDEEIYPQELSRLGYRRGAYAVLAIPRHEAVWETSRIPTRDPAQLARIILNEAKAVSPWPEDATAFGYDHRDDEEEGYSRVDYMFVRRDLIQDHVARLRSWGIVLSRVELSTLGLARLLASEKKPSQLARVTEGQYEILHCAPGGKLLLSIGVEQDAHEAMDTTLQWMAKETKHDPLLYLAADESTGRELPNARAMDELQPAALNGIGPLNPPLEVCIGAALSKLSSSPTSSLLPRAESLALALRKALRLGALLGLLLISAGAMLWGLAEHYVGQEQAYLSTVRQELRSLREQAGDLESKWEQLRMMRGELAAVPLPLRIVLELYERTPVAIAINHMRFDAERSIILSGEAPSHAAVFHYVASLRASPVFTRVKLESSSQPVFGAQSLVDFKITCTLHPGNPR